MSCVLNVRCFMQPQNVFNNESFQIYCTSFTVHYNLPMSTTKILGIVVFTKSVIAFHDNTIHTKMHVDTFVHN